MNIRPGYVFDDVLLVPRHSTIKSRSDIDLTVDLGKGIVLKNPIVSSNMKHITDVDMAKALTKLGSLAILHRFVKKPEEDIWSMFKKATDNNKNKINNIGISVGIQLQDYKIVDSFIGYCKIYCVDVAHGDTRDCLKMVEYIASNDPSALLIAGNIATKEGALRLHDAGANVIKVGIGNGSICSTRIQTGNGVPQLTALEDVFKASKDKDGQRKFKIISDGGCSKSGDLVKALCFSDAVMLGNLLAGTDEAPGNLVEIDGIQYKEYAGSSTFKTTHVEGVAGVVKTKGPVELVIQKLLEGVRSGCSYQGVSNLEDLKEDPEFVSITNAGLKESHPHDIIRK